jgi:hypothetical protein
VKPPDALPRVIDVGGAEGRVRAPVDVHRALPRRIDERDDDCCLQRRRWHYPRIHAAGGEGGGVPTYVGGGGPSDEADVCSGTARPRRHVGRRASGMPFDLCLGVAGD